MYAAEGDEDQMFSLKGAEKPVGPAPRAPGAPTPWTLKAQEIVARFSESVDAKTGEKKMDIEHLTGTRDVHIFSFKDGRENREARGGRFEHDAVRKISILTAAESDPNARAEVWQGKDWMKSKEIRFEDGEGGGQVTSPTGGIVQFEPKEQAAVDPRAPKGPVNITCLGPIVFDRRANRISFSRDAVVNQKPATLKCRELEAFIDPATKTITRVEGRQEVRFASESMSGEGNFFEWDVPRRRGYLTGQPQARGRGPDGRWISGDRVDFELDGQRVKVGNPVGENPADGGKWR